MRVHPSQLTYGSLSFFGPSNFWVKAFNLNNKKIVLPVCFLFLISVIGSAINKDSLTNFESKFFSLARPPRSTSEPLAIVLTNDTGKVLLLSAPIKSSAASEDAQVDNLELSYIDRLFLEEAKKLGSLSLVNLSEAAELPLLTSRSTADLKYLLDPPPPVIKEPVKAVVEEPIKVNLQQKEVAPVQLPVVEPVKEVAKEPEKAPVEPEVHVAAQVPVPPPIVLSDITSRIVLTKESKTYGITKDGMVVEISQKGEITLSAVE